MRIRTVEFTIILPAHGHGAAAIDYGHVEQYSECGHCTGHYLHPQTGLQLRDQKRRAETGKRVTSDSHLPGPAAGISSP